jgi:hypothetical protein
VAQLYTIERDLSGYSADDLNAAGFRAKVCTGYFLGMRWVRSFIDEQTLDTRCFYEAGSADDIRKHSYATMVPCDNVRPVTEVCVSPEGLKIGTLGDYEPLRDDSGRFRLWVGRHRIREGDELFDALKDAAPANDGTWVRSFIDLEGAEVYSVFRALTGKEAALAASRIDLPLIDLGVKKEILPLDVEAPDPFDETWRSLGERVEQII